MKRRPGVVSVVLAILLCSAAGLETAHGQVFGTDSVRVQGSKSVAARIDLFANQFIKDNPGKTVVVIGGETGKGIDHFLRKNSELLMMSRRLTPDEMQSAEKAGMKPVENQVGVGSIVLVVNPANPVTDLTVEQAGKILAGAFTNWKEVGGRDQPITVLAIDNTDSDTRDFLKNRLLSGQEFTPSAATRPIYQAILRIVSKTENAIGFARATDVFQMRRMGKKDSVKILGLRVGEGTQVLFPVTKVEGGHAATDYPLEQNYFLYYDSNGKGKLAADFAVFCEQQIVTNPGEFLDEGVESSAGASETLEPVTEAEPEE
jgi:phosphate transport system substrate-binding protein